MRTPLRKRQKVLNFIQGTWSLMVGLGVTLKYSFFKTKTLRYPQEKRDMPTGVKGPIRFVYFDETNSHDCIACNLCVKVCPSFCIEVKGGKTAEGKRRPFLFKLDYGTCSLCTLCVEVCPTKTLEHSTDVEWAGLNRTNFLMDFLKDTTDHREKIGLSPVEPAASQETAPPSFVQPKPAPPKPEPPQSS